MTLLVRDLPGAAESAPDLFEPPDRALLWETVTRGGPELRLLRATALGARLPSAAAELALPLAKIPGYRLEAAALLLAGGRAKAARDALVRPPALAGRDEAERLRIEALLLAAELRLLGEPVLAAADAPRARAPAAFPPARRLRGPARPGPPETTVAAFRGARGPGRRSPRPSARPAGQATAPDGGDPRRGPLRPRRRGAPIPAGAPGDRPVDDARRRGALPLRLPSDPLALPRGAARLGRRVPAAGLPLPRRRGPPAGDLLGRPLPRGAGPGRRRALPLRLSRHDRRSRPLRPLGRRAARRSRLGGAPPRRRPARFPPPSPPRRPVPAVARAPRRRARLPRRRRRRGGGLVRPVLPRRLRGRAVRVPPRDGAPEGALARARDAGRRGAAPGGPARLLPVPAGGAHRPRGGRERPAARARLRRHPPGEPLPDRRPAPAPAPPG